MNANDLSASAYRAIVAATSDTVDLPGGIANGLYIGVAGALKIRGADGVDVTFPNVIAGYLPIKAKRVWATGTAATGIMAVYNTKV